MTSPTNGKFTVSLSIASAVRILSLSKIGGRPPLRPRFLAAASPALVFSAICDVEEQSPLGLLVGYARVSTLDQNPRLQIDALKQAGCERIYVEKASGAHRDRPELKAALEYMRPGDTLVVWRLSRLARSLRQIIETAHNLEQKKQALRVLTRNIDTGTYLFRKSFSGTTCR